MRTYVLSCLHHPAQVRNDLGMTATVAYQSDPREWRTPFRMDGGHGENNEGRKTVEALSWFQGVDTDEFIVVLPEKGGLPRYPRPIMDAHGGTDTLYFGSAGFKRGIVADLAKGTVLWPSNSAILKGFEVIAGTEKDDHFEADQGAFGMIGYGGNDRYKMGNGNGHHYILDRDDTPGNVDLLELSVFAGDRLVFSKVGGHDLRISVAGSDRSVTILRWFDGPEFQIESLGLLISDPSDPEKSASVVLELPARFDALVEEAELAETVRLAASESKAVAVDIGGEKSLPGDDGVDAVKGIPSSVVLEQEEPVAERSHAFGAQVSEAKADDVEPIGMSDLDSTVSGVMADLGGTLALPLSAAPGQDDSNAPQADSSQASILRVATRMEAEDGRPAGRDITGTPQNDFARGRGGNDIFQTGTGLDHIRCGPGNDWVIIKHTAAVEEPDQKYVLGDSGWDTADYLNAFDDPGVGIKVSLKTGEVDWGRGVDDLFSIEHVIGTHFADVFEGDTKSNFFEGHRGNDIYLVDGKGRNDRIRDEDATDGNMDIVRFGPSIKASRLSKEVVNDDLILIVNGKYRLTIEGAASDDKFRIERFELHDGSVVALDQISTFQPIIPITVDATVL